MILRSKLIPVAFMVFGLICGIFGFLTELSDKFLLISSGFYLQIAIVSLLAAIYFQLASKD
jgi:hypothetical protein